MKEISVRIGTMSQILMSSLNNMMWDFAERELIYLLSSDEYKKLRWSHDFPIAKDIKTFKKDKNRILRHIKNQFPKVYKYIEASQPYHQKYSVLWAIKLLSNDTKHTIPVKVIQPNISCIVFEHGGKPKIVGDKAIVPFDKNNPVIFPIPCFIEAMDLFVSKDGQWKIFMIDLDTAQKISVTGFIAQARMLVGEVIVGFYRLWQSQKAT